MKLGNGVESSAYFRDMTDVLYQEDSEQYWKYVIGKCGESAKLYTICVQIRQNIIMFSEGFS